MYLEVMPNGSKYWRLKYRIDGKEKRMALGVYPAVTLLAARKARDDIKEQLRGGLDPSHEKKRVKVQRSVDRANSFEPIAREWHAQRKDAWSERHADRIMKLLERELFPILATRSNLRTRPSRRRVRSFDMPLRPGGLSVTLHLIFAAR
jgi:hypothetical protein